MKKHYYTDAITQICDNHHLTVDEIFMQVQQKFPEAGKSSIYRNVEELAKSGALKKLVGVGKKSVFEKAKEDHAHFICTDSGKILDIPLSSLDLGNMQEKFSISEIENIDIKMYGKLEKK